jgi:hypothetical protein
VVPYDLVFKVYILFYAPMYLTIHLKLVSFDSFIIRSFLYGVVTLATSLESDDSLSSRKVKMDYPTLSEN